MALDKPVYADAAVVARTAAYIPIYARTPEAVRGRR